MKQFLIRFLMPFLGFLFMALLVASGPSIVEKAKADNAVEHVVKAEAPSADHLVVLNTVPSETVRSVSEAGITDGVTRLFFFLAAVGLLYGGLKRKNPGVSRNGVEVEIWVNYIIERLWKDNSFLQHAFSDDDKVLAGKIVHIPQPGAKPSVVKNRAQFPATAVRRTDSDILYPLDEYTTDPTHIPDAEKVEVSYDKISSVYGDHAGQLVQDVADDAIIKWLLGLPQTAIIKTTGAGTAEILDGATGQRKVMVHDQLRQAQKVMNKQNIPGTERSALISANMADELFQSLSNTQYRDFSQYADAANGVIGKLYGFDIMTRSSVAVAEVDGADLIIKPWGAAAEAGDRDVSFCWHKSAVARALGEVKFFENPDRAEYYGDVYSSLLRFGGRRRRADNSGIVAIIQDNA